MTYEQPKELKETIPVFLISFIGKGNKEETTDTNEGTEENLEPSRVDLMIKVDKNGRKSVFTSRGIVEIIHLQYMSLTSSYIFSYTTIT